MSYFGLTYSSSAAATVGDAGIGWSLGLTAIEVHNSSGPPLYNDDDQLAFGGQPLVRICTVKGAKCSAAAKKKRPRRSKLSPGRLAFPASSRITANRRTISVFRLF